MLKIFFFSFCKCSSILVLGLCVCQTNDLPLSCIPSLCLYFYMEHLPLIWEVNIISPIAFRCHITTPHLFFFFLMFFTFFFPFPHNTSAPIGDWLRSDQLFILSLKVGLFKKNYFLSLCFLNCLLVLLCFLVTCELIKLRWKKKKKSQIHSYFVSTEFIENEWSSKMMLDWATSNELW